MRTVLNAILTIGFLMAVSTNAGAVTGSKSNTLERVTQKLVAPPFLPEHEQVAKGAPKVVQVRMVIEEKRLKISPNGPTIWAMTFNGSVPGPIIVVHQNDYVELTLVNPITNTLEHNIDFHAATGALGGAELTHVSPGEEVVLRFNTRYAEYGRPNICHRIHQLVALAAWLVLGAFLPVSQGDGRRQSLPIHLPVGRQRHGVDHRDGGWPHIVRQRLICKLS